MKFQIYGENKTDGLNMGCEKKRGIKDSFIYSTDTD